MLQYITKSEADMRDMSLGGNHRRCIRGCEWIAGTQRRATYRWDLQYGSWSTGHNIALHNSSSSWRYTKTTHRNTHWTVCCRSVISTSPKKWTKMIIGWQSLYLVRLQMNWTAVSCPFRLPYWTLNMVIISNCCTYILNTLKLRGC